MENQFISRLENSSLPEALEIVAGLFPGRTVFSSSLGREDMVLTDIIFRNNIDIEIFTIDTGRLFNESYELLEKISARYKRTIKVFFPDAGEVEQLVSSRGINGFYESVDARKQCCAVRKIGPLNRALADARVWITGLRGDQSGNRKDMRQLEWLGEKKLYKFNPLFNWKHADVVEYIDEFNVPYNVLHDRDFISIGCAPCTRAIAPGEDERSGRWWWETGKKECGLHEGARTGS